MFVVIFRAKARALDAEYSAMAAQMRQLALTQFGCLDFTAVTEGEQEIASPVYVRMFTRFDEPVEESALSSFAHRLAHALASYTHSAIDVGTMSYQGGEDFSFAVGESIPAR